MAKQTTKSKVSLRYDAYGRPVKNKQKSGAFRFFVGFLLPYLVINGLILFLVITKPNIEATEPDTTDYQHATIRFSVDSVLPLRSVTASMEGEEITLEKNGKSYTAEVGSNGNLSISIESLNRMTDTEYVTVNILDETAPEIDEDSVDIGNGYVEFQVSDTQSGVDFDNLYAVDSDGDNLKPTDVNKAQGIVTFAMKADSMTVYVQDLAGNQQQASFTLTY